MKIQKRMLLSHLFVGVIPVLLAIVILSVVVSAEASEEVKNNLNNTLSEIIDKINYNMDNLQTYSYFLKRAVATYDPVIKGFTITKFNLSVNFFNIPILEYSYSNNIVRSDFHSSYYATFSTPQNTLDDMWSDLSKPFYNSTFKTYYPDVVVGSDNLAYLVIRNCSIIYNYERDEKLGITIISIPFDQAFLYEYALKNPDLVIFIKISNDIIFSSPEFNTPEIRKTIADFKIDEKVDNNLLDVQNYGRYYIHERVLYRIKDRPLATIGILYGFKSINRLMTTFQSISLLVALLTIVIGSLISIWFSQNITASILALQGMVSEFKKTFRTIQPPKSINDELDELQDSFYDMSVKMVDYKHTVDKYNDMLTNEVEKKTRELMGQIRSLMLINQFSSYITEIESLSEEEFLKGVLANLKTTLNLQYISLFFYHGKKQKKLSFLIENTQEEAQSHKRIKSLEKSFIKRVSEEEFSLSKSAGDILVYSSPLFYIDKMEYALFFIAEKRRAHLIHEVMETLSNLISIKINSMRMQLSKIESEKMATIGQFASTVVHDIKNPLTVIKSIVELLNDPDFNEEERREYIVVLKREIEMLTNMLGDILDFSKGKLSLMLEDTDLDQMMAELKTFYEPALKKNRIELQLQTDFGSILAIDRNRIWRCIGNILQNAIDVLETGGKIILSTEKSGKYVQIKIADNGRGIPEEIQKGMFTAFFTYGKKNGTGLGLTIVKKIIESHSGTIHFESVVDKGTTFFIKLPIK